MSHPHQESVWFMAKRGEERRFVLPFPPSEARREVLKKEGYCIFRIMFSLPDGWDGVDFVVEGTETEYA